MGECVHYNSTSLCAGGTYFCFMSQNNLGKFAPKTLAIQKACESSILQPLKEIMMHLPEGLAWHHSIILFLSTNTIKIPKSTSSSILFSDSASVNYSTGFY